MKKTVWIVYDAREPYDGGADVLLACPSEDAANRAAVLINAFARRLRERIAALDMFADGISDDEHGRRWERHLAIRRRARWPLGVKRGEFDSIDLTVKTIAVLFVQEVA